MNGCTFFGYNIIMHVHMSGKKSVDQKNGKKTDYFTTYFVDMCHA